jgi:hypothetical protein
MPQKKESLFGMLVKGKDYKTEQRERTERHPIRARAENLKETPAQRRARLKREAEARRKAKEGKPKTLFEKVKAGEVEAGKPSAHYLRQSK